MNGLVGHQGSDKPNPLTRIAKYATIDGNWGACSSFGLKNGREVVLTLLIDDGVEARGHRDMLLNNEFTKIGSYVSQHLIHKQVAVQNYTASAFCNPNSKHILE
jgi:uncharacterized protein YkwD